ncbi:MAG TPA: ROK family transcriptional regulator [Pseudonocardiaceae bacterium]|jgi:predicted NBD/HSP70 family sugar kinase|nr:ROK family transcriptional regulator [Pseudonocardiaceae bacterium]
MGKLSTVRDLRRGNRSVLLTKLFREGSCSRQELSRATGLSQATVSNVIGELIADGVVAEAGLVDSDGGRPRTLLRVDPSHGHVIGVDVGETKVQVERFDLSMSLCCRAELVLHSGGRDVEEVVSHIVEGIRAVLTDPVVDQEIEVLGVGIGVPGIVERGPRLFVNSQAAGWGAVPLAELVQAEIPTLPLQVDNGAKTLGLAEMWFGTGRGTKDAVVALIGSGVGASVIANGSAYQGATGSAGEWGHTTIEVNGRRCRCGANGCLEAYIGAGGILDRYQTLRRAKPAAPEDEESALAELLGAGTATATKVIDEVVSYLGAGLANLINLFNPELIIVGGWAGLLIGERKLPEIRAAAAEHALHRPFAQTTIELAELGQDAVALGAAALPVEQFLAAGGTKSPAAVQPA